MQPTFPAPPAAKPRRRRWPMLLVGILLLLAATPGAVYFTAGWLRDRELAAIYTEIEADDPHWRWDDLVTDLKPLPDEQNAAARIGKVRSLLRRTPLNLNPKLEDDRIAKYCNSRLPEEASQLLRTAFSQVDPVAIKEARKLKDMPNGRFPLKLGEGPFVLDVDYVQDTREAAKLLRCDAMLRAQDNDCDGAAESCRALVNTARAIKDHPSIIAQLVRIAIQAIAVGAPSNELWPQGDVSEENLKKLQEMLEAEVTADGLEQAMRGERALGHQAYSLGQFPVIIFGGGYPEYLRMLNGEVKAARLKDTERDAAFRKLQDKYSTGQNVLTRQSTRAMMKINEASRRAHAQLGVAIVGVAAERFRSKQAHWPSGIDELIKAGLLKEHCRDPYDGNPLRWKRVPTGVIIYSVGPDKIDNGGKLDRSNLIAPGTDVGFELWNNFNDNRLRGIAPRRAGREGWAMSTTTARHGGAAPLVPKKMRKLTRLRTYSFLKPRRPVGALVLAQAGAAWYSHDHAKRPPGR